MNVKFTFNELMIIQIRLSHCTRNVDYVLFMIIIYYIVIKMYQVTYYLKVNYTRKKTTLFHK